MVVKVELGQSSLYLLLIEVVATLGQQLKVVLACLVAHHTLRYDHLKDTLIEERPLPHNLRLLDLEKQKLAYLRLFLEVNLRSEVIV